MCSANAGGAWAPALKFAGLDMLVVEGASPSAVSILVSDGVVSIRPAGHLWGETVWETINSIRGELSDQEVEVLSIGPAGERGALIASIMVDRARAAGHGGCGAVMGSKRLKAIACRGGSAVRIASPGAFGAAVERAEAKIAASHSAELLRQGGTHLRSAVGGFDGRRPTTVRNSQDEAWAPEKAAMLKESVFRKRYEVGRTGCFNCSMRCGHFYSIHDGPYAGLKCEGVQSNAVRGFGSNLDVVEPAAIVKCNALCNEYGLDVDGASNVLAWAVELYQRGILTAEDTDGLELAWGDHRGAVALLEQVARGEGLGKLLQNGVWQASQALGRGSDYYGLTSKHHDLNESALRSHKGWALGVMTSARGGGHLNGAPSTEFAGLDREVSMRMFGVPTAGIPSVYEGKAKLVVHFERLKAIVDAVGMCYFTSQWTDVNLLGPEDYAALYSAATGDEKTPAELMALGEEVVQVERRFNYRHAGFSRKDDYPPLRLANEAVQSGLYAGERLHMDRWNEMLDRYYLLHGWNPGTGLPMETSNEG